MSLLNILNFLLIIVRYMRLTRNIWHLKIRINILIFLPLTLMSILEFNIISIIFPKILSSLNIFWRFFVKFILFKSSFFKLLIFRLFYFYFIWFLLLIKKFIVWKVLRLLNILWSFLYIFLKPIILLSLILHCISLIVGNEFRLISEVIMLSLRLGHLSIIQWV